MDFLSTLILGFVCGVLWLIFFTPLNIKKKQFQKLKGPKPKVHRDQFRQDNSSSLPPFPNGWYAVLESTDLRPGSAQSMSFLGQDFTVFRSVKGNIHVVEAYCPHLGANLGYGTVEDNCIKCPFHFWKFNGIDGRCVDIPYKKKGKIPLNAKIQTLKSYETQGIIFLWFHADNKEPWTFPTFSEIDENGYMFQGRNEYSVECHIQDIPENGADISHLKVLHENFVGFGSYTTNISWITENVIRHKWNAEWQPSQISYLANLNLFHSILLTNKFKSFILAVKIQQIGPGIVKLAMDSRFGSFVCLQTVTPVHLKLQRVIHRFYRSLAWFVKLTLLGECLQFERDVKIWNNKKYLKFPILLKEDQKLKVYRAWFSQFYS